MRRKVHRPKIDLTKDLRRTIVFYSLKDALLAGFRVAGSTADGSIICTREQYGERAIVVSPAERRPGATR